MIASAKAPPRARNAPARRRKPRIGPPAGPTPEALLAAMVKLPSICPLETLRASFPGCDPEALAGSLADLQDDGMLETFKGPKGLPSVVLTPLGASRMGVRLDGTGTFYLRPGEQPWDAGLPTVRTESDVSVEGNSFRGLVDHRTPGPLEAAAGIEADLRRMAGARPPAPVTKARKGCHAYSDYSTAPRPRMIVGLGVTPYTPETERSRPCAGCKGRPLGLLGYCVCCCSSGAQALLEDVPASERPRPSARPPKGEKPTRAQKRRDSAMGGLQALLLGEETAAKCRRRERFARAREWGARAAAREAASH